MERGRGEGQVEMFLFAMEKHSGVPLPEELAGRIRQAADGALLKQWQELACAASSLEEFQQRLPNTLGT
jgi:hypothetical protein